MGDQMNKKSFVLFVVFLVASVTASAQIENSQKRNALATIVTSSNMYVRSPRGVVGPAAADLKKYVGKYPSDLFKHEPSIKTRLRKLLGANYQTFMERMETQTPIEKDGDILVMRGCAAHECTEEEALLAIDLNDGKLYVALRFGGKFTKTFPANRSELPEALKRAMAE